MNVNSFEMSGLEQSTNFCFEETSPRMQDCSDKPEVFVIYSKLHSYRSVLRRDVYGRWLRFIAAPPRFTSANISSS